MSPVGANSRQRKFSPVDVRPLPHFIPLTSALAGLLFVFAYTLQAQQIISARAGMVSLTQGRAFISGRPLSPNLNALRKSLREVRAGQSLTTREGRAEILLGPDIYLRLDRISMLRLENETLTDPVVELQQGVALIEVVELPKETHPQIRVGDTLTTLKSTGLYRFEAGTDPKGSGGRRLFVYGGDAEVAYGLAQQAEGSGLCPTPGPQIIRVTKGKEIDLSSSNSSWLSPVLFDRKNNVQESFHSWSAQRSLSLFAGVGGLHHHHWVPTMRGTVWNANFSMELRSGLARRLAMPEPTLGILGK